MKKTLEGDEQAVAKALDVSHIHVTSNRSYNNEDALQSAGKGFADVVFLPVQKTDTAMIIELKKNGNDGGAAGALDQIRRKQYFDSLTHYQGNLLFVGIDYDEKEKTHTCRMERFYKDQ